MQERKIMSLIKLKSKTEPKYFTKPTEPKQREPFPEVTDDKVKKPINSASSLQIGNGVTITGSIKADNESVLIYMCGDKPIVTQFTDIEHAIDYVQRAPSVSLRLAK